MDTKHDFVANVAFNKKQNACLKCGKTEESHGELKRPEVHIYFGGKLWKFKNWQEARKYGFYLG